MQGKIYITDYKCIKDGNHSLIVEQLKKQPLVGAIITSNSFSSWGSEVPYIYELLLITLN